ncbi:hypothetical protein ACRARG_13540 [Pseudooceanicola sp. C21-150M6]|uniref:hypothetical protein n=1 Tax=Pseudooceanicola sp. C21-150M6 TaxID=3434355 RepID=UPI003D7F3482
MLDYHKLLMDARSRLRAIDAERDHLLALVKHAEALAASNVGAAQAKPTRTLIYAGGGGGVRSRPAPTMAPTRIAAREILDELGMPVETRDLLPLIQERGIEVGGKDPIATLSARLSNSEEFKVRRGVGWWFSDRPFPGEDFEEAEDDTLEGDTSASS